MDPLLPLLLVAGFGTAALSATFGMAGGLVLMGVYTLLLPVPQAMVLHGVTQLVANGGRAWLLRGHVGWAGVGWYGLGALVAWVALRAVAWVPDPAMVFLGLGALPFVALALPAGPALDFGHRRGAALAGLSVGGTQMLLGVAGPLLDLFFVRTAMLRREVVATKAVTQTLSHSLKIALFLPLLGGSAGALVPAATASVGAALVGTWVGGQLLERIGEDTFRRWTRRLVLAVGAVYLVRGVVELA
jgi:uncharacterized membrane protein YfcA